MRGKKHIIFSKGTRSGPSNSLQPHRNHPGPGPRISCQSPGSVPEPVKQACFTFSGFFSLRPESSFKNQKSDCVISILKGFRSNLAALRIQLLADALAPGAQPHLRGLVTLARAAVRMRASPTWSSSSLLHWATLHPSLKPESGCRFPRETRPDPHVQGNPRWVSLHDSEETCITRLTSVSRDGL